MKTLNKLKEIREPFFLTDNELEMLIQSLEQITFNRGIHSVKDPEQVRLERKLERWREHPDLIFT